MKLSLKFLIAALQLIMIGCAVKIDVKRNINQCALPAHHGYLCFDESLPNRDRAFSMFKETRKFQTVSYDCAHGGALRVTRFDFSLRPHSAHCGAQLLTTLSLGLIPSMCEIEVGGVFCVMGKTGEACFGPTYYHAEALQGIVALPLLLFGEWTSVNNAEGVALDNILAENCNSIAILNR